MLPIRPPSRKFADSGRQLPDRLSLGAGWCLVLHPCEGLDQARVEHRCLLPLAPRLAFVRLSPHDVRLLSRCSRLITCCTDLVSGRTDLKPCERRGCHSGVRDDALGVDGSQQRGLTHTVSGGRVLHTAPMGASPLGHQIIVDVPARAGTGDGWGEILPLAPAQAGTRIVVDLTNLSFADPYFLLRLRAFMEWHSRNGLNIEVVRPRARDVANYLSRMRIADGLPPGCTCDLAKVEARERKEVLIPVTRLASPVDADHLDSLIGELLQAHFQGQLARLGKAFHAAFAELTDNATTHGASPSGTFVAAQRYRATRCVLAIADTGIGIPEHVRRAYPYLDDDGVAIAEATKEGVSGADDPSHRGIGYQYLIDSMTDTNVPFGDLRIWSGRGRFAVAVRQGEQRLRRGWKTEPQTAGTFVRVELATR